MGVSENKKLRSIQHCVQERMPRCELGRKFLARVYSGIHRAVQTPLGLAQGRGNVGETRTTDDHQINIAGCQCFGARHGAVYESPVDTLGKGFKHLMEHIHQAGCLCHEPLEFGEKGTVRVGLKVNTIAVASLAQDLSIDQSSQLALEA